MKLDLEDLGYGEFGISEEGTNVICKSDGKICPFSIFFIFIIIFSFLPDWLQGRVDIVLGQAISSQLR